MSEQTKPAAAPKFDAREYAARVWQGQSPSLPLRERVARIKAALTALGVKDMKNLGLPKEAEAYL